jgi:hypothetical protein
MRRPTAFSPLFSTLKLSSASVAALAAILACSDNTAPKAAAPELDPSSFHLFSVPESEKEAYYASVADSAASGNVVLKAPAVLSADVLSSGGSCSSGGAAGGYTKARIAFAPEADPVNAVTFPRTAGSITTPDDGYISDVPIGFDFNFYGNTYNKLNLYLNGFVTFGVPADGPSSNKGFWITGSIPLTSAPTNMISLAWNDWNAPKVPGSIRYETRGTAPNRRFLIQFRGVPEVSGSGTLTALLVLSEGSNQIEIHTTNMNMTSGSHRMTQGVENAAGTDALYDSALTAAGLVTPRNRGFFALTNDAVRFSPLVVRDEVSPVIPALENITADNDPGLASAVVAVSAPQATDNCSDVTLSSVRSDGKNLNDPYPVGVTTITWTAKDASLNSASASQTVTVLDVEAPVFAPSALSVLQLNATSPSGAVATFSLSVQDNVGVTSLICDPPSGSLFAVGSKDVVCTAFDAAGNHSSSSFSVLVIDAHTQLFNLIEYVRGLNLPNGTAQPVINQLRAAYDQGAGDAACNKMSDFESMVLKKDSNIPSAQVTFVIGEANRIMGAMGCSSARASVSTGGKI